MLILRSCLLRLLVLPANVIDGEIGRQTLLQLICLVAILQDERVQEAVASDFKLDLGVLAVALYAGGGSIFPSADLDELLDVGDFGRHGGRSGGGREEG